MSDVKGHCCGVFKEAWHKVKGMKRHFWGGVALFTLIGLGAFTLLGMILVFGQMAYLPNLVHLLQVNPAFFMSPKFVIPVGMLACFLVYHLSQALLEMFVLLPMRMGVRLIPLRHIQGKPISSLLVFKFFHWEYIWRFVMLEALVVLFVGVPAGLGFGLFVAPKILALGAGYKILCYVLGTLLYALALYLFVSYFFVNYIIIDRRIGPWHAMELSRKTVGKRWFCIFGTLIWLGLVMFIGGLLLFIGLFWAVPYTQNVIAIMYRDLIGIEGQDPASLKETH